ncbi:perlucin-like protein [Penaeus japonicus]|uniref:perlucin-like protein n=1 Tax=Penaeus japonicus TaxID=27405 RepID=UPI001C7143CA|nr:perlucin-like protein [Penaeus japonicus]
MSRLVLALLAATSALVAGDCPLPYEALDEGRCIFLDPFVAFNWQAAVDHCKTHGGTLLSYSDCDTFALVYDYIRSQDYTAAKVYWIGARDEAEEGLWKFIDGTLAPMGVPFWLNGEPNSGNKYNCAVMHNTYNHYWIDYQCTSTAFSICLRDAS